MDAIKVDQIDVGILATPIPEKGFEIAPLFYENILIYCNSNHNFASYEEIDVREMRDQKIWLLSNGNCFRNQAINLCELKAEFDKTSFYYESASIETLIKLVDKQGGITLIPELAVSNLPPSKRQYVKPFKRINPVREVSLITNRIFVKKRMISVLGENIKKGLSKEMLNEDRGEIVEWN